MWENVDNTRADSAHYSVMRKSRGTEGMVALREMFPDAMADEMNLVLFSTSGVHGTYNTIEEAEATINGTADEDDRCSEVTFLIVQPRLVALRYGACNPRNPDDIDYLKQLRASSHEQFKIIGMPCQKPDRSHRMTFEEWLIENESPIWYATRTTTLLRLAYNAGVEEGKRQVSTLPHRVMFDAGHEQGFREGLEKAAEIAEKTMAHLASPLAPYNHGVMDTRYKIIEAIANHFNIKEE